MEASIAARVENNQVRNESARVENVGVLVVSEEARDGGALRPAQEEARLSEDEKIDEMKISEEVVMDEDTGGNARDMDGDVPDIDRRSDDSTVEDLVMN